MEYKVGHRSIWLSYYAWKMVEDGLRAVEKGHKHAGEDDDESVAPDDATDYSHRDTVPPGGAYFNESNDNLLLTRTGTNGTQYHDANAQYGAGGLRTPNAGTAPEYSEADEGGWGSEWDKKGRSPGGSPNIPALSKEGGMVVNNAPNAVEEVPTSRARRWWLFLVWAITGIIPSFCLRSVGRMKRPDIRLAWREKLAIFMLIFLLNATVIFYIVEFGRLLCPNRDKAWDSSEVAQHQGSNDYWVSIQGAVFDVSNFVHGDHSDIVGESSNGQDTLDALAGQDLTNYFPPPLILACPGLVSDPTLALQYRNFSPQAPTAIHNSGQTQAVQNTKLDQDDWYTAVFQPKIEKYKKGPLVWEKKDVQAQANDQTNPR
jgi:chitin synthase